jgi:hypothetical protein
METYRLSASALLRLASLAALAPNAGFGEILDILRGATPDGVDTVDTPDDADKPAKPE